LLCYSLRLFKSRKWLGFTLLPTLPLGLTIRLKRLRSWRDLPVVGDRPRCFASLYAGEHPRALSAGRPRLRQPQQAEISRVFLAFFSPQRGSLIQTDHVSFFDSYFLALFAAEGRVAVPDSRRLGKRGELLLAPSLLVPRFPQAPTPSKIQFAFTARSLLLKENGGRSGNKGGVRKYFLQRPSVSEIDWLAMLP